MEIINLNTTAFFGVAMLYQLYLWIFNTIVFFLRGAAMLYFWIFGLGAIIIFFLIIFYKPKRNRYTPKTESEIKFFGENHYTSAVVYWEKERSSLPDKSVLVLSYSEFEKFYKLTPDAFEFSTKYDYNSCKYYLNVVYKCASFSGSKIKIIPDTRSDFDMFFHLYYLIHEEYISDCQNTLRTEFLSDYRSRIANELSLADKKIEEAKKNILDIQSRL